jgi:GNAT superfamily N-acetyltransferase
MPAQVLRPLEAGDVVAAQGVQTRALDELSRRLHEPVEELTHERRQRCQDRITHLQLTDPEGAWVAEIDGEVAGCALALVRDGMWFLSLLMVDPPHQGKGLGKQLLDATLATATGRSWILATADPAALRRYQRAGFDLHASFTAKGHVDRTTIPPVHGVRPGSYDTDAELVNEVAAAVRGASMARDLRYLARRLMRLLVVDDAGGRGFVLLRPGGVASLAATTEDAARRLLWTALAEAGDTVEIDWLSNDKQWAIDVCVDARLSLVGGATLCFRGQPQMPLYLPSGALG